MEKHLIEIELMPCAVDILVEAGGYVIVLGGVCVGEA